MVTTTIGGEERYCPVFVDVSPQETLEPDRIETICIVGLIPSPEHGVEGLRQFKATRKKRWLRRAEDLRQRVLDGDVRFDAVAVIGRSDGALVRWGVDTINGAAKRIGATWVIEDGVPVRLRWNGEEFSRQSVLGLSAYAGALPILALRACAILRDQPVKRVQLLLDRLPFDTIAGAALLQALPADPGVQAMWKENAELGFSLGYGVIDTFRDASGAKKIGKDHPNSILVDWLAASARAYVAPDELRRERGYTAEETAALAGIWTAAEEVGSATKLELDDRDLARRVREHEERAGGPGAS